MPFFSLSPQGPICKADENIMDRRLERTVLTQSLGCPWHTVYGFAKIEEERPVQYSTGFSLSYTLLSSGAKPEIQYFPLASCLWNNIASSLLLLFSYSSLPRNTNLLHCPACSSSLPPPISPFRDWQSIRPRHPSTAACPQQHPGPGSSCLVRNVCCCFPLNTRQQERLKHKVQVTVPNLGSKFYFTFW